MGKDPGEPLDRIDAENKPVEDELTPPRIPSERYDLKILQALRKIIRGVDIHSRKLVATHDITAPQLMCLITIVAEGPLTLKQIAERVFLSPSTVVGILDRLAGKRLVLRARDTRDRRLVNVTATPTGRELVERAPSPLQEGLARGLKDLPEIEQTTIALSLQRVVDLMEVETLDAAPVLDTRTTLSDGTGGDAASKTQEDENGTLHDEGVD
jgi:DNA-binding MarR family transcriptional regulator